VAERAVVGNGRAGGIHELLVVAAEAAAVAAVVQVAGVGAPPHRHERVDVPVVHGLRRSDGFFERLALGRRHLGQQPRVGALEARGDAGHGRVAVRVIGQERPQHLAPDERQRPVHEPAAQPLVHRRVRLLVDVGGPVVAVHAVQRALPLFRRHRHRPTAAGEPPPGAVLLAHLHPEHLLPLVLRGGVADRVGLGHVPVNAGVAGGLAGVDLQVQGRVARRRIAVHAVMHPDLLPVTVEFVRPVALFARLPGGAELPHGRGHRPLVGVEHGQEHLPGAVELGADQGAGALTHMAVDAAHPGVGRDLVGGPLGVHHLVAGGAAEDRRVHEGEHPH